MDFIAAVVAIVAIVFVLRMRGRVTALEQQVTLLNGRIALRDAPPQAAPEPPAAPSRAAAPVPASPLEIFAKPAAPAARTHGCGRDRAAVGAVPPPLPPPPAKPPSRAGEKLRGALRRELGGLDRRPRARARRHLPGAVFDRGRADRPEGARLPRRPVRRRPDRGRRMDAAARILDRPRQRPDRAHPEHPHGGRHDGCLRDGLRGLRALRLPRPRHAPSCCSASWRSRRSRPRCCTGRRSRRSGRSARSSRRC